MTKTLEAICAMWPNSIPAHDYAKMLRLVGVLDVEPIQRTAKTMPRKKKAASGEGAYEGQTVSDEVQDEVRQMLTTGPATVQEVADAVGIHYVSARAAIIRLGGIAVGKKPRPDGAGGLKATIWGLPEKRTP